MIQELQAIKYIHTFLTDPVLKFLSLAEGSAQIL